MKKVFGFCLVSILLLTGCGGGTNSRNETSKKDTQNTSSTQQETVDWSSQSLHDVDFSVPSSWEKKEGDTSDTVYYYPEEGMLMVSFTPLDMSIKDNNERANFIDGLSDSEISADNESEIDDAAFLYDTTQIIDNDHYQGQLLIFDVDGGLMSFYMATPDDSYSGYKDQFTEIWGSISYTKPSTDSSTSTSSEDTPTWDESEKTFTTSDIVLKIDDVVKTTDYNNAPALRINFTLTNNTDEVSNAQILYLFATQVRQKSENTSNDLTMAIMPTDSEDNHLSDNINPGGTISGYYAYSLENETDPIEITFKKDFQEISTYSVNLN